MFIKKNLLGIDLYDTNLESLIAELNNRIVDDKKTILFGVSSMTFGRFKYRRDLIGIYKKMDIVIAEGAGLPALASIFGVKISGKIGLVNASYKILELANETGYKVMLFGSTNLINQKAEQNLINQYPNLQFCKGISGFFEESDLDQIVYKINECKPDILLIGITYPIKERFSLKYKDMLKVKLIVPCGGAFEVFAGEKKKFKEVSKYIPTAWLIRFIQEPIRLYKPIIGTMLYSILWVYPQLIFMHIFIEKNPSIAKFFNISDDEWNSTKDSIKF